jgi:phosphate-selective porin OprO and OprP
MRRGIAAFLLTCCGSLPQMAFAQEASSAASPVMTAEEAATLRDEVKKLREEVAALKAVQDKQAAAVPSWRGSPQWADKEGWSFAVKGRLFLDSAYMGEPDNYAANRNLGFNTRLRSLRIGVDGSIPGGFGYKAQIDFANANIGFGDVILTYAPASKPLSLTLGNHNTMSGMEQTTSQRVVSFLERAQGNDAFLNARRLGLSAGYRSKDSRFRAEAGLFAAHSIDGSFDNDGWIAGFRTSWSPEIGKGFAHLGFNYQHREFQSNDGGTASNSVGAPSTNQIARYRARPFLQTTDVRYVDTGNFAASSDDIVGVEAYGVFGPLHFGGEAQYLKTNAYAAGDIATGLDAFAGGTVVTPSGDPAFWSGFFEVGYYLTGETRGYRNGTWDRTRVKHPFSKGGWGGFQLVARLDHLDLDSGKLKNGRSNNFATGATTLAPLNTRLARGGTQTGYLLGLTWMPTDYVRFLLNYIHTRVEGGPFAAIANPLSTKPVDQRSFSTDAMAVRAQFDF